MKRIQLIEFEDLPWFPNWLRQCMMTYLQSLHRMLGTADVIEPLVRRGLRESHVIIDLCSGAGGPMIDVVKALRSKSEYADATLVLTDLYPNHRTIRSLQESGHSWIRYEAKAIDAAQVPSELLGLRTMICCFHHMPPSTAKKILQDTVAQRQPFLAFEISDNSSPFWLWWFAIPVGFLLSLILTIWVRPLTVKQLFFTYCIPIIPAFLAWDGAVSNARTYTPQDLNELLTQIDSVDYKWEISTVRTQRMPSPMLYILGLPKDESNCAA
jgi:hypothetical protein